MTLRIFFDNSFRIIRYNLKIIFAGKFIYFLLAASGLFLLIVIVGLFDTDWYPEAEDVFGIALIPGILLIFYPTAFAIQNDSESRMLEMLFGIPDYRYKVYLVRMLIIAVITFIMLLVISYMGTLALVPVNELEMSFNLLLPIFCIGSITFLVSTWVKNGNGTAAIISGLLFLILLSSDFLEFSRWNIFLNPYDYPRDIFINVWDETILYNRLFLICLSALALFWGLYNMQKRERYMQ